MLSCLTGNSSNSIGLLAVCVPHSLASAVLLAVGESIVPRASASSSGMDASHQGWRHDEHLPCPAGQRSQLGAVVFELGPETMAQHEAWVAREGSCISHSNWGSHQEETHGRQWLVCQGLSSHMQLFSQAFQHVALRKSLSIH